MKRTISRGVLTLVCALLVGCGGAQKVEKADPVSLLAAGRYSEARSAALAGGGDEVINRAVVALCYLAEGEEPTSMEQALESLLQGGGGAIAAAAAADQMLGLVSRLPANVPEDLPMTAVEVALAAAGKGPLARVQTAPEPGSDVARSLAASILDRLHLWLASSDVTPDAQRLLDAWNGSYSLLGGSMHAGEDDLMAWKLYSAVAGLAVVLDEIARDSDLTKVLLRSAVEVVEENPAIAIAGRCDIASPLERLRKPLSYDRELSGRLERALASATGCNRGKFAPTEQK